MSSNLMNDLLLLVHIPKTAGTSLRKTLAKEARIAMHYDYGIDSPASTRKLLESLNDAGVLTDNSFLVENKSNIICGHVAYQKYSRCVDKKNVLSILRNPVERLVSEYQHLLRHKIINANFKNFIFSSGQKNKHYEMLADFDELENGLIGLASHYEDYLALVNKRLGVKMNSSALNRAPESDRKDRLNISLAEINMAFELNRQDMAFFMKAADAFRASLSREGVVTSPKNGARFECRIDSSSSVAGWVSRGENESLFVELSVNGERRAMTSLEQERKRVAELGYSETVKCGFSYPLTLLGAGPGDTVGIRVLGNDRFFKELLVPEQDEENAVEIWNEQDLQSPELPPKPDWVEGSTEDPRDEGMVGPQLPASTHLVLVPQRDVELTRQAGLVSCTATGDSPQLKLEPQIPALMQKAGWVLLRFHFECAQPLSISIHVDCGPGFMPGIVITKPVEQDGTVDIRLYLPKGTQALRLDLPSESGKSRITESRLFRVKWPGRLNAEHARVCRYLKSLDEVAFELKPLHQITQNQRREDHWTSCGNDPGFLLQSRNNNTLAAGWHQADLLMSASNTHCLAKFYLDTGSGYSEAETIRLPAKSGSRTRRIFRLDREARRIRFDPMETEGDFRIETLQFTPISEDLARDRMLQHLVSRVPEYGELSPGELWQDMLATAPEQDADPLQNLLQRYDETFNTRPGAMAYAEWIETVEAAGLPTPETVREALKSMRRKPLISIVMPAYNTPEVYLRACIDSVLAQSYPEWELCIADDNSPKAHVREILDEYARKDRRIRVAYRKRNGHISRASNSALKIARGEYVALLDHDDALPQHALYFIAQAIDENPAAQILYSDEDKLDAEGSRFDPHFKSDWNPYLFYAQNYVSHLGVYKHELLKRIGGFRAGVEGSQDQDLLLRCLPHIRAQEIIHIPRVLYHWRAIEGSTALASGEGKSYTTEAGIKALRDHFAEHGPAGATVEAGLVPNTYRVRWPIPEPAPKVSLLIPTRDKKAVTETAVRSILDKTTYPNYEIIILDNGSVEDETLVWFDAIQKENGRVTVLRYDHPFNYSAINNFGVAHACGSLIGLINNDIEVISPDWLSEMVSHACRKDIGCVGAKLYYSNDTLQHGGVILGLGGVAGHSHKNRARTDPGYFHRLVLTQNLSAVTAACLIVRREVYEAVGGLDEDNLRVAFNDVDFCLKVRQAGYRNLWTPYAELYHHESISRGHEDTPEKQERFRREIEFMQSKWRDALKLDPYYSPNLTTNREDFSIGV